MYIYETHIAADEITEGQISAFLERGFLTNEFVNLRSVNNSKWRATYKSDKPFSENEWNSLVSILSGNGKFEGTLIEEIFDPRSVEKIKVVDLSKEENFKPLVLEKIQTSIAPPGAAKKCDLHITISKSKGCEDAIQYLDRIVGVSVDRPKPSTKRIYTITFEKLDDGENYKEAISKSLKTFKNVSCNVYLEKIKRYTRIPDNAKVLDRVSALDANEWLKVNSEAILEKTS